MIFLLYVALSSLTISHHEIWGDELHSWNIAKSSATISDVVSNSRYEGHPPVWYIVLWSISRCTQDIVWMQVVHWVIITSAVFVLLFFSPIPCLTRSLIPFGYFFLFEYAALSRNYAIALLLLFCILLVIPGKFRYSVPLYYVLLFILANTHLLALILAGSLHLYFLVRNQEKNARMKQLLLHGLFGLIVLLPTLYFIFPPTDSALDFSAFWGRVHIKQQLAIMLLAPVRSFIPVPAWWNYNFWNTQFLLNAGQQYPLLKGVTLLLSVALSLLVVFILKGNRKSLLVFIANFAVTMVMAAVFPLTTVRYTGFIFISFITAWWIYTAEAFPRRRTSRLVNILLAVQIIASAIAVYRDIRYPFSNAYQAGEVLKEVPTGKKIVTDFWCADMLSTYTGQAFYCVDMQRAFYFLQWKDEYKVPLEAPDSYYNGMKALFAREHLKEVYFITARSREYISRRYPPLLKAYQLDLVDKRDYAIEESSNLYLFRVTALHE
ncbi:hypothetical protein [uncultured Chitinophaga sp.]|uniref:hypothetical protein n=1 Tax=uncultured Chitinophaga sp. TaxID=339340 RepID=UPI00261025F1|nr:hypothetical protein [uncultured Chitinophaga sp.]